MDPFPAAAPYFPQLTGIDDSVIPNMRLPVYLTEKAGKFSSYTSPIPPSPFPPPQKPRS